MAANTQHHDTQSAAALANVEVAFEKMRTEPVPQWLQPMREKAFETFRQSGFPEKRDEDWKYTSLTGFAERSAKYLQNRPADDNGGVVQAILNDLPQIEIEHRVLFVNGFYRPDLSTTTDPGSGIELTPYSTVDKAMGEKIIANQPIDDNAMVALNTAFLSDGLAISVADDTSLDTPIHIVFAADGQPAAAQPRLSIDIGRNASALIIQHHVSAGECLTNAVTAINCAERAQLLFVRLQNESAESMHVANQVVRVAADARFDSVNVDLGSQLARNDLEVDLHGERAHASLFGLFMGNNRRHLDNHLRVDHRAPNTTSVENYRGILNDTARGVFNGKIIVHSGADGTDAQMSNRNLLLSERAEVDTKPELEIYTDDVKCAHGSTTGQLDTAAVFYLRARGIPEAAARIMLVGAFAQEIIDHIRSREPQMAEYLSRLISQQIPDSA